MKFGIKHIAILLFMFCIMMELTPLHAQIEININSRSDKSLSIDQLNKQKEKIKTREKEQLQVEIDAIDKELADGKITPEVADQKKHAAAKKHASNIKNQLDIIDANIELINRNKDENSDYYRNMGYLDYKKSLGSRIKAKLDNKPHRTQLGAALSFGFNNAIGPHQSIDNSPYKMGNSGFFTCGLELQTMLSKTGYFRMNYGFEFQFNNLHPSDNFYFEKDNKIMQLSNFDHELKKAKISFNNIVIPVHLEIGKMNKNYHSIGFRLGIGGYAGLNMSAVQTLKYKNEGHKVKKRIVNNYNTNNIIYGVSAYIGWRWFNLYAKYDLNNIFTHNPTEEHNISIGLRLLLE